MELKLSSDFNELSMAEMNEVDGGEWKWYYDVIIEGLLPPVIGKIVAMDLRNCYENGYYEVMQGQNTTVSSGDAK